MNNFVTVGELADFLGCPMIGERNKKIFGISLFQDSTDETLTYIPWKDINKINDIDAGAILTRASIGLPIHRNYIITKHEPYEMLAKTIQFLIDRKVYEFSYNNKPYICSYFDFITCCSIQRTCQIFIHLLKLCFQCLCVTFQCCHILRSCCKCSFVQYDIMN